MNTAMQELIDQMYKIYNWEHTTFQERAGIANCIGKAKKLLEKEKQQIIQAYDHSEIMTGEFFQTYDNGEEYYNNNFK